MKSIEVSGKTVDEAIFNGLDQLGLGIDEVDIEIVEEGGRGLFGIGSRQSVVRLTERNKEQIEEALEKAKAEAEADKAARDEERRQRPRRARPERTGSRRDRGGREHGPRNDIPVPARNYGEACEPGAEGEFLNGILKRMGMESEITCQFSEENNSKYINISGKGMGVLIGRRGETLNAIQYLCSLVGNKGGEDYHRVVIDAENYRGRREQALLKLAANKADDVRRSGRSITLEPMNPYDRRVLHSALQDNPNVTTHSVGDEPNRRVVIESKAD